jgi:hypothetical protein
MNRPRWRTIEAELRAQPPGDVPAPARVGARVLAMMDDPAEQPTGRPARVGVGPRLALGGVAFAGVALAVGLLVGPDAPSARDTWWPSSRPVRLSLPESVRFPAADALEDEARRIQRDMVELTGLVRVPVQRLLEASRGPSGPA